MWGTQERAKHSDRGAGCLGVQHCMCAQARVELAHAINPQTGGSQEEAVTLSQRELRQQKYSFANLSKRHSIFSSMALHRKYAALPDLVRNSSPVV